ncbi:MAG: FecR family protein [Candidatus Eremiobacteraeota bacterium]|nr:FecR family protein [Candidatus Eremiobacteraeota bacterium]
MRKKLVVIIVLSILLSLIFVFMGKGVPPTCYANREKSGLEYVADVISVQGDGLKIKRVNSGWFQGRVNMADYKLDKLETDGNTVACIELLNGSQIGMNKNTKIEIITSTQVKDITKRSIVRSLVVKSGAIWAKIRGKDNNLKVQTGKGVLGVKGTEFFISWDPSTSHEEVSVLHGVVDFTVSSGKVETLRAGDQLLFDLNKPFARKRVAVSKLREVLNGRFPGLDPRAQAIIGVFAARFMGRIGTRAHRALRMADQTMSLVDNPESYIKSHIRSRVPVRIPSGIFGQRKPPKKKKAEKAKNLKPNGGTLKSYYPKFTWDKVDGAEAYRVIVSMQPLKKGEKDPQFYMIAKTKETELTYPAYARALKPGWDYFWTVIPLNKEGKPIAPAATPAIIKMADYATLGIKGMYPSGDILPLKEQMIFDWTPVMGVNKYKIVVSEKESLDSPVLSKESTESYLVMENPGSVFSKDKQYYWKVTPLEKEDSVPDMDGALNRFKIKEPKK